MSPKNLAAVLLVVAVAAVGLHYALAADAPAPVKPVVTNPGNNPPDAGGCHCQHKRSGQFQFIEDVRQAMSDPDSAGLMALGGLKDDVKRTPQEQTKEFETLLPKLKSLTLRNGTRMILKDLYKAQGQDDKVLETLRAIVQENDKAIEESGGETMPEPAAGAAGAGAGNSF